MTLRGCIEPEKCALRAQGVTGCIKIEFGKSVARACPSQEAVHEEVVPHHDERKGQ